MAKITIDRGHNPNKLSAEAVRSINNGILEVLGQLGDNDQIVKVITVQPIGYKGNDQYLKIKIVLTEPAITPQGKGVDIAAEFDDEFYAKDDSVAYIHEQIKLKIIHMGSVRQGQHLRLAELWKSTLAQIMAK